MHAQNPLPIADINSVIIPKLDANKYFNADITLTGSGKLYLSYSSSNKSLQTRYDPRESWKFASNKIGFFVEFQGAGASGLIGSRGDSGTADVWADGGAGGGGGAYILAWVNAAHNSLLDKIITIGFLSGSTYLEVDGVTVLNASAGSDQSGGTTLVDDSYSAAITVIAQFNGKAGGNPGNRIQYYSGGNYGSFYKQIGGLGSSGGSFGGTDKIKIPIFADSWNISRFIDSAVSLTGVGGGPNSAGTKSEYTGAWSASGGGGGGSSVLSFEDYSTDSNGQLTGPGAGGMGRSRTYTGATYVAESAGKPGQIKIILN